MTKNTITASVEFYFKGQRYTPSATIELDEALEQTGTLPDFYPLLAARNDIDIYSYHYEVMQMEPIRLTNAQGLVAGFLVDGQLDEAGFKQAWQKRQVIERLDAIARRNLGVEDIEQQPGLKQALLDAYHAGADSR